MSEDDGCGTRRGCRLAERRYDFAPWLAQTGRLREGRAEHGDEPATGR